MVRGWRVRRFKVIISSGPVALALMFSLAGCTIIKPTKESLNAEVAHFNSTCGPHMKDAGRVWYILDYLERTSGKKRSLAYAGIKKSMHDMVIEADVVRDKSRSRAQRVNAAHSMNENCRDVLGAIHYFNARRP